jgi:hypothetical protein
MPVRLILRRLEGRIVVMGCNDGQVARQDEPGDRLDIL